MSRYILVGAAAALLTVAAGCASGEHPPDAPPGLKAVAGNRSVTLTWDQQQDVDYFTLFYGKKAGVGEESNTVKRVTSPYRHTPLENGVTIYYRLRATNVDGNSPLSQEVSAAPTLSATAPGAPASVTATPGDGKVTLTWGAVSGASKYIIYRDTNTGVMPGTGTVVDNVTSPSADTGLTNGNTYYYVVTATVQGTESLPSAEVYGTPKAGGPSISPPSSLAAAPGDKQVTLTWPTVADATGYTLYWGTAKGVTRSTGTKIAGATSPYTHSGLTNGATYYYVVTASKGSTESSESTEASATPKATGTPPKAPAGLVALSGDKKVTLNWTASAGATGYTVYWGTATGVTQKSGTAITGATSPYAHSGLTNGATYYYVVTAKNVYGESAESLEASAKPQATATKPFAPTGLSATAGDKKNTLSWNASAGATSYTLYWAFSSAVSSKTGTAVSNVTSPYAHTPLTNGTTYHYVVVANNSAGSSPDSNKASATPKGTANGTFLSTLSGGAWGGVILENTYGSTGVVQVLVFTSDPNKTPAGTGIAGLKITATGALTGSLPATTTAGIYSGTVNSTFTTGTYNFKVVGTTNGTMSATLFKLPTCVITKPTSGSTHTKNTNLPLGWTSTNSTQAKPLLKDSKGTVFIDWVKPDVGGTIIPGYLIPYASILDIVVSAAWTAEPAANNGKLVVMGDGFLQIILK